MSVATGQVAGPLPATRWRTRDIVVTAIIGVAFGVVFWAWGLAWSGFDPLFAFAPPAKDLLYAVWLVPAVLAPLIVPYIVQAVGLFRVFLVLGLRGTVASIIIAHTVIAIPYVVLVVSAGLMAVPKSLEEAARVLGANGFTAAWRITLPLIQPSIAASAVFALISSWDEFIMAFFLAGASTETLPIRMFLALRDFVDPRLAAISTLLVIINLAAVLLFTWFLRRSRRTVGIVQ